MECPLTTVWEYYQSIRLIPHILVFCNKNDSRHIEVKYKGLRIHSVYVPAGGDIPDASVNKKFEHKLNFLREMKKIFFQK